jgi:integrase
MLDLSRRAEEVDRWLVELRELGRRGRRDARGRTMHFGPRRVREVAWVLRSFYSLWIERGRPLPHGNPVPAANKLEKVPTRPDHDALTVADVHAWRDAMPEELRVVVDVEAYYGGREGEILALREGDIRFTGRDVTVPLAQDLARIAGEEPERYRRRKATLRFERKLERDRATVVDGYPTGSGPIKNAGGNRTLPLPQWLAGRLAAHLADYPPVGGWLFTNPRRVGWHIRPVHERRPWMLLSYNRFLRIAAAQVGLILPRCQNSHALRHHTVSVLRAHGKSNQEIGRWIGDTARTVEQYYGKPMPDSVDRMAETLDAAHGTSVQAEGARRLRAVDAAS